jgi:ABC-type transport system substrate-binding protein
MYILGWGLTAYADHPVDFFHSRNDCPGGYNTPGIKDDELDALLEEFEQSTDLDSARDLNHQVQALLAEKRPYIPLFQRQAYDVIRDNVVLPYTEIMGGIADAQGFQSSAQPLTR